MVKSPAAPVPCCKTIPPLWEAVEFPLSMVQMTPACKPLTEMFLDNVSAAGGGRGRGWERWWSLRDVISIPWVYCIAGKLRVLVLVLLHLKLSCQPVAAFPESARAKGTLLSRQRVQGPVCRQPGEPHCSHISRPLPWEDLTSLASFHAGHLVFYLPATHLLFLPSGLLGVCNFCR